MRVSHYIWLFLILISSIPHYFVISNHIIFLISKKNSKQILFNKKKFQIKFESETKYSPKLTRTPTRNQGNRLLFPRSPRNDKLPFPDSPNPRGIEIAGELASLQTIGSGFSAFASRLAFRTFIYGLDLENSNNAIGCSTYTSIFCGDQVERRANE